MDENLERQKIDALAEFAAGVGHELNNPLAIISGHAQQLMLQTEDEAARRSLAVIMAQVRRAYEMIADIRLFARPPQPEMESFELLPFMQEVFEANRPLCDAKGISLALDATALAGVRVVSDPVQLRVVLDALCRNAREAMRSGHVRFGGFPTPTESGAAGFVQLFVEDDGPGIPESVRPLIFCPYFSGRDAGRGLGFGLPKAWRIIEQLAGTIRVEPVEPHGTRFVMELGSAEK